MAKQKTEPEKISPEEQARIWRGSLVATGYGMFLRWTASLPQFAVKCRSIQRRIYDIGGGQRFAFYIEGETFYLLAQSFEMAWLEKIPWDYAVFHTGNDSPERKLYLVVNGGTLCGVHFKDLAVGIDVGWRQFQFIQAAGCTRVCLRKMQVSRPPPGAVSGMPQSYEAGAVLPLENIGILLSPEFGEMVECRQSSLRDYGDDLKSLLVKLPPDISREFTATYGMQDAQLPQRVAQIAAQVEYPASAPEPEPTWANDNRHVDERNFGAADIW